MNTLNTLRSASNLAFIGGGSAVGAVSSRNKWQLWNPNVGRLLIVTRVLWSVNVTTIGRAKTQTSALANLIMVGNHKNLSVGGGAPAEIRQEHAASSGTTLFDIPAAFNTKLEIDWSKDPFLIPANFGLHLETTGDSVFAVACFEWLDIPA
jgi:hypothetical protein